MPRILVLTHRVPVPQGRGDRIRPYYLLRHLHEHHDVDLACASHEPVTEAQQQRLEALADRVAIQRLRRSRSLIRIGHAAVRGGAISPAWHRDPTLEATIAGWHAACPFDVVITCCITMSGYAESLTSFDTQDPPPRQVLDLVDVGSLQWAAFAQAARPPARWIYAYEARRLHDMETHAARRCEALLTVSDSASAACRQHLGAAARHAMTIGNGVDLDYFTPQLPCDRPELLFVGALNDRANVEAVCWFVEQVMPALRASTSMPSNLRFRIAGRQPSSAVRRLDRAPGVEVIGSVNDVRTSIGGANLMVVPLQTAEGIQNKVLEAMASYRAVVCSPQAATGLNARDGEHLSVARDPTSWVATITNLLRNRERRDRMAGAARRFVETYHTWEAQLEPLIKLLDHHPGTRAMRRKRPRRAA